MVKRFSRILLLVCVACGGTPQPPPSVPESPPAVAFTPAPPLVVAADAPPPAPKINEPLLIHTDPGELPQLELASDPKQKLTLEHTHVSAKLNGFVAEVEVTQQYTNPFPEPIEARYVFPLPENSAVNHLRMVIAERVIEAQVKQREQAKRVYDAAKRAGHTAALLEQERPNVFTQSVANIAPKQKVDVVVRYLQDLTYDAGAYEFVFPMVVGPRYMPSGRAPDAARISPPYVGEGQRSGRTVSLELIADARQMIGNFETPTHEVVARKPADGTLRLTLAEKESIPNRDFVLRYRVAGAEPKATMYLSGDGFLSLVVQPPQLDVDSLVGQRELIFVVDVSGSMSGQPLAMCQEAMRSALQRLRPVDTFNILTFAGSTRQAFESSRPANNDNIRQALRVVQDLRAGGGTELGDAVQAALRPAHEAGRTRYVFFMTDGYVGNESEILQLSREFSRAAEGKSRVFGFGVGSSVNRYLIDGLSQAGNGVAVYATNREDPRRGVDRFFHYVDRAVLEHLQLDLAGLETQELFPNPLPDLFASHPVIVHGRYRGKPTGKATLRAQVNGQTVTFPIDVQAAPPELNAPRLLGTLWAREKLTDLDQALSLGSASAERDITKLGLDFHLVTRFTSLVAVDTSRQVGNGDPKLVTERLDAPEGVDVRKAGGVQDETNAEELPDPCAIDPAACPMLDLAQEAASAPTSQVYGLQQRRGCGCRAVGGDGAGTSLEGGAGLAVLFMLRRRRNASVALR